MTLTMRPGGVTLEALQAIHAGGQPLAIDPAANAAIAASAAVVQRAAQGSAAVYGVNTGFGKLASTRISAADLATLQLNLIRSHSVGVGEPLAPEVVRLMLALKAASLARGHSGVVIVCDGTDAAARRIERVLWNDPATGVMRHADAGYEVAVACAKAQGLKLPFIGG